MSNNRQRWIKGNPEFIVKTAVDLDSSRAMNLHDFLNLEVTVIDRKTRAKERGVSIAALIEKYS